MRYTIVGDTLLDVDVVGCATRLSPDGAAPIIDVRSTIQRAGGAGLVASMLRADGFDVQLVTALADDDGATRIRSALAGVRLVSAASTTATPEKTRLRVADRTLARIDRGCGPAPVPEVSERMLKAVRSADAVVVADYGRGMTSQQDMRDALAYAAARVPVVWDPHPHGAPPVRGTAVATPNAAEAVQAAGDGYTLADIATAADRLCDLWQCPIAVTVAEKGAILVERPSATPVILPTAAISVADPCGAGDRFSSSLSVALAHGAGLRAAVRAAVAEAGLYLTSGGVSMLSTPASPPFVEPPADDVYVGAARRRGTAASGLVVTGRRRH